MEENEKSGTETNEAPDKAPVEEPRFIAFRTENDLKDWEAKIHKETAQEIERASRKNWVDYCLLAVFSCLCAFIVLLGYHRFYSTKIYTMNLIPVIEKGMQEISAKHANSGDKNMEAAQKEMADFLDKIKLLSEDIATKKKGVVLINQAVVSGASDITEEVTRELEKSRKK